MYYLTITFTFIQDYFLLHKNIKVIESGINFFSKLAMTHFHTNAVSALVQWKNGRKEGFGFNFVS